MSILDAGAGTMRYAPYCKHLRYESQDFCQYDGKGDGAGCQNEAWDTGRIDIISEIDSIPRADSSYDVVMCTEVFEHVPNPLSALKEFHRLLKPHGKLILTAPFCSLTHQSPYYYYNGFSKYWYVHHLSEMGFCVDDLVSNGNYFEYLKQEIGRVDWCQRKYSDQDIVVPSRSLKKVLKYLDSCSRRQAGSEDLLCFGWHVVASNNAS